jgi:hypothetical protein
VYREFLLACFLLLAAAAMGNPRPQATQSSAPPAAGVPNEIHVDPKCRIQPDPTHPDTGKQRAHGRTNWTICHLDSVSSSDHVEETVVGNERRRSWIIVQEQEYILQNVTTTPMTFVVEQPLGKDWAIDSEPKPTEMAGATAVFRVQAEPRQIVRLHVGMRHTAPMRTRIIRNAPPSAPAASSN